MVTQSLIPFTKFDIGIDKTIDIDFFGSIDIGIDIDKRPSKLLILILVLIRGLPKLLVLILTPIFGIGQLWYKVCCKLGEGYFAFAYTTS